MRQILRKVCVVFVLIAALVMGLVSTAPQVAALSTPVLEILSAIGGTGYVNLSCKVLSDGGHKLTSCAIEVRETGGVWSSPGTGSFSADKVYFQATRSGLQPRTVYDAHCYVTYIVDGQSKKAYTEIVQVMTRGPVAMRDLTVVNTTTVDATFSINIIDDGNAPPIQKIEFIVDAYPSGVEATRKSIINTNGLPTGIHTLTSYSKLTPNTEYEVTCWVTNNFSPVATSPVRFKTLPLPPVVSTSTFLMTIPNANNTYNATMRGTVSDDNGDPVTERGFVYGTSSPPTLANGKKVTMGTGTGSYSATATGLLYNVKYYYRAYATNRGGTSYGVTCSVLKTPAVSPTPTTAPTPSVSVTPTSSPTPSLTPSPTVAPTPSIKATPTPTRAPSLTAAPLPTSSAAKPTPTTTVTTPATTPVIRPTTSITMPSAALSTSPTVTNPIEATPSITGTSESPTDSAATTVSEMITGESTILSAKPSSAAHVVETISTGRTDTSAEQTAEIPTASPVDPSVPPSGTSPFLIWLIAGGATVLLGGAAFFFIRKH